MTEGGGTFKKVLISGEFWKGGFLSLMIGHCSAGVGRWQKNPTRRAWEGKSERDREGETGGNVRSCVCVSAFLSSLDRPGLDLTWRGWRRENVERDVTVCRIGTQTEVMGVVFEGRTKWVKWEVGEELGWSWFTWQQARMRDRLVRDTGIAVWHRKRLHVAHPESSLVPVLLGHFLLKGCQGWFFPGPFDIIDGGSDWCLLLPLNVCFNDLHFSPDGEDFGSDLPWGELSHHECGPNVHHNLCSFWSKVRQANHSKKQVAGDGCPLCRWLSKQEQSIVPREGSVFFNWEDSQGTWQEWIHFFLLSWLSTAVHRSNQLRVISQQDDTRIKQKLSSYWVMGFTILFLRISGHSFMVFADGVD